MSEASVAEFIVTSELVTQFQELRIIETEDALLVLRIELTEEV